MQTHNIINSLSNVYCVLIVLKGSPTKKCESNLNSYYFYSSLASESILPFIISHVIKSDDLGESFHGLSLV